jgi:hypothetical protein
VSIESITLALITESIDDLKRMAYSSSLSVRLSDFYNQNSTEEVILMVKSYDRFGHLTVIK